MSDEAPLAASRKQSMNLSAPRLPAPLAALATATLVLSLTATSPAMAAVPDKPLYWSTSGFNKHSEAVEHITIRARLAGGLDTFIRFSVANAAYKKGALTITFKQQSAAGTLYAKKNFKRGRYSAPTGRFGLVAGGNSISVEQGSLVVRVAMGRVKATARLKPHAGPITVRDTDKGAWIRRSLIVPRGTLTVTASDKGGRKVSASGTAFAVHEASKIKAHRTYERSVQLHHIRGARIALVDYIVGPNERGYRPLGFMVLYGGGVSHVGKVTAEKRTAERRDKGNDYRVPWNILVTSKVGERHATVELKASRQVSRKDDLAKLSYFTRKAVSFLIHPFTYGLRGEVIATAQRAANPATSRTTSATWKYAQAR